MLMSGYRYLIVLVVICLAPQARAQWAVVDAPALVQLVKQVVAMKQQIDVARDQLQQARAELQTMTGDRGMQLLLSGTSRNYLPATYAQLNGAMQGTGGGYPGLASDVRSAIATHAILTAQQLATLPTAGQQQIAAARQTSALQQALAQEALANASNRFASLQSLINAIGGAADQKAALDLQARISAELGMLQNEQTKLLILQQATQAQEAVNREQEREQVIAGHGQFQSRFQPKP
jgi:type IV secretion system protein VirB5